MPCAEQAHDLAVCAAADVVVFVQDHAVEGVAEQFALANHVDSRGGRRRPM